jgi:hypothetical protein
MPPTRAGALLLPIGSSTRWKYHSSSLHLFDEQHVYTSLATTLHTSYID